jgi:hypothetical protein
VLKTGVQLRSRHQGFCHRLLALSNMIRPRLEIREREPFFWLDSFVACARTDNEDSHTVNN